MKALLAGVLMLGFAGGAQAQSAQPQPQASSRPSLAALHQALVGTWQDLSNTRFTREFDADGTSVQRLDGDPSATASGHWRIFDGAAAPSDLTRLGVKFDPADFYVEIDQSDDTLLYGLAQVSRDGLQLVYLERGNTLFFERLK
jgi:hypothetical protein